MTVLTGDDARRSIVSGGAEGLVVTHEFRDEETRISWRILRSPLGFVQVEVRDAEEDGPWSVVKGNPVGAVGRALGREILRLVEKGGAK